MVCIVSVLWCTSTATYQSLYVRIINFRVSPRLRERVHIAVCQLMRVYVLCTRKVIDLIMTIHCPNTQPNLTHVLHMYL